MPGGQKVPIAAAWQGLNRAVAPHLLDPTESPETYDAANSGDVRGVLGPRRGRTKRYTAGYRIMGVVPCNFPWGRYRIVSTDASDGAGTNTWAGVPVPWPSGIIPSYGGWDRLIIDGATVTRTLNGDTNGAAKTGFSYDLSAYGVLLLGGINTYYTDLAITYSGGMADGYIGVQMRIDTVWTDLWRVTIVDGVGVDQEQLKQTPGTGTFDQMRLVGHITSGNGTITGTLKMAMYLVYGSERSVVTAV